jgi:TolB-like protein/Flp pilus assembly protein TadD
MSKPSFLCELKRRNVYRVAAAYAIVGWLVMQIAATVVPALHLPGALTSAVVLLIALGFPMALLLAWAFELTPGGIKRTPSVAPSKSRKGRFGVKLIGTGATLGIVAAAWFALEFWRSPEPSVRKEEGGLIPEKSIAVLPFVNLSANQENAYFADGVQEEILTTLAKVADLKVISRTSVMVFRDVEKRNLRQIAQQLGVAHVLEGSVQRAADRVRVTAQLIDVRSDSHLWAERYDGELADVFGFQTEIAQKIAGQLKAALSPEEQEAVKARPTTDIVAYDLYLRAKEAGRIAFVNRVALIEDQVRLLDEAVARDPGFVLAHCLLARAHLAAFWFYHDRTATRLQAAKQALEAAERLQPDAGEVRLARAIFQYWGSRNYAPAIAELTVARRALPNDADVLFFMGAIERRQGRWEESTRHFEAATIVDPRNARIAFQLGLWNYLPLKRYADAARVLDRVLAWQPDDFLFGYARARLDLYREADLRRMEQLVVGEAATKSPDAELVARARCELALAQRDYLAAQAVLDAYALADFREAEFIIPREFYSGLIARGLGDPARAESAFLAARARAATTVAKRFGDGKALIVLAEIDAYLGRKEEAISEGEQALALLPVARDAIDGPVILTRLAGIYAQTGESVRALDLLEQAADLPNGPSYGELRLDEVWDPLRPDPRFQQIVASVAPISSAH